MIDIWSKILVAVDGSESNKIAVRKAVSMAKALGAELTAVTVVSSADVQPNAFGGDVSQEERKMIVDKTSKAALDYVESVAEQEGVKLEVKVLAGNPAKEIVKISKDYDLIICGSLGLTGITKLLLGSVSTAIVKYADCSVLIAREE